MAGGDFLAVTHATILAAKDGIVLGDTHIKARGDSVDVLTHEGAYETLPLRMLRAIDHAERVIYRALWIDLTGLEPANPDFVRSDALPLWLHPIRRTVIADNIEPRQPFGEGVFA